MRHLAKSKNKKIYNIPEQKKEAVDIVENITTNNNKKSITNKKVGGSFDVMNLDEKAPAKIRDSEKLKKFISINL
jgi:hypothetical protein